CRRGPLPRARRADSRLAKPRRALRVWRPETRSAARRHHALPRAAAPGAAADAPTHCGGPAPIRRGRGRRAAGLDQRARSRALSDAVEPLRTVRSRAARPARVSSPPALRVLGPRGLPGAGVDVAVVASGDAGLSGASHGLVRLAATQRADAATGPGRHR